MSYKKFSFTSTGWTIFFIIVGIFLYNILNGLMLNFSGLNQESLRSRFSEIHFSSPGNDFWGGVFWLPIKSLTTPQEITDNKGNKKTCTKQLRWIYYNAARGARLRPLDNETLALLSWTGWYWYNNLQINWWLYTSCWPNDQYGIFWVIQYVRWGTESYIIAGTKLNYQQNDYISEFANTFEYFNNVTPLGYFWDSVWWIWFIGGSITWSENLLNYLNTSGSISNSFLTTGWNVSTSSGNWSVSLSGDSQAQDTMRDILIQGNVILSKAIDVYEKKALLGNLEKRTILINSDISSAATIINVAKKNSETLCRGKTYIEWGPTTQYLPSTQEKILCYKNTDNLEINLANELHKGKTIIVKKGNITLTNSMTKDSSSLDIFVDEGNVYIKNPVTAKINFNQDWYPSDLNATNSWIFIKGNFIINGLLIGKDSTTSDIWPITNKLHLLWKIAFLNTPTSASQWRINQVNSILWTTNFQQRISLENVFSWYCDLNWIWSDWTNCWGSTSSATVTPFVVLNANYPSNIIK